MTRSSQSAILLFLTGGAVGLSLGLALAQGTPQFSVNVKLDRIADDIPQPATLQVREDRWAPGAETGVHDHPGPAILAIIEGELVEETPTGSSVLRTGQVVWRGARQSHNVKNVSDKPARMLAIHFDPAQ